MIRTHKKPKLCFCCLDGLHFIKEKKTNRTSGVSGCSKKNKRLLHSDAQKPSTVQTGKPTVEGSTNSVASKISVLLQILQIRVENCDRNESQ